MSRFRSTRLLYIPSLKRCVRFNEFRNEHLLALYRTSDSLPDSICTQWDIIEDCIVDGDVDVSNFTVIDMLFIFLSWRVNCVNPYIEYGDGMDDVIDVTEWFHSISKIADNTFRKCVTLPKSGYEVTLDLPTIRDDMEMQRVFMTRSGREGAIKENVARHTICTIRSVKGVELTKYSDKEQIFNSLPPVDGAAILEHVNEYINGFMEGVVIDIGVDNIKAEFALDLIPVLVKFLFAGKPETIIQDSLFLSKRCNINYEDFMNMTPMDSKHSIDFFQEMSKNDEGSGEGVEDLTDQYFEQN